MFSPCKPDSSLIEASLNAARNLPLSYTASLNTRYGPTAVHVPPGFVLDHTRSQIGDGAAAFEAAKAAFRRWQHFDLGWVRIANPDAEIKVGQIVAVQAHSLGLWSLNFSHILYIIDESNRFGFGYGTTPMHVERGEERFLLELDLATQTVHYDLLAISQPAHWMARLAYPYTRSQQRRFARKSHTHMQQIISSFS